MHSMNSDKSRVLLIDDEPATHDAFRRILGAAAEAASGAQPRFALDVALQGDEALRMLQAARAQGRPYSLAFVDMRTPPGWDGVQTIQRLWTIDPDLQVVICTAYSDRSWREITQKLGLEERLLVLRKPSDPAELRRLATTLTDKWALGRAVRLQMDDLERIVQQRTLELTHLAWHDKLTGLPNRSMFQECVAKAVDGAATDTAAGFAVLVLDFDRFKLVNDSLGHDAGDDLLVQVSHRLSSWLRDAGSAAGSRQAIVARLGGDEFGILIDSVLDVDAANRIADDLLVSLGEGYRVKGQSVASSASIGITTSAIGYARADDVLRDADIAMYHAKGAGRARHVLFDRQMHEDLAARIELENELRGAAERGEMVLYYQPIVSLATGKIVSAEALVRWNHPRRGLLAPGLFIPQAEETNQIVAIGQWVLNESCRQLRVWQDRHPHLHDLTVSVNLSVRQLAVPDLVAQVAEIIRRHGIPPASLTLEITESVMICDPAAAVQKMHDLKALGLRLHMDDFGTGYSSLSCLHRFPIDGLKIDRSFIQSVSSRRDYAAVVSAIVVLARNLGMKLVAEGIETPDQVVLMQTLECDYAQGYHFAKPLPAAQFETMLVDNKPTIAAAA